MDLSLDLALAQPYASSTQRARVLSESWVSEHLYCPNFGNSQLSRFANNRKAADFECVCCNDQFELKSGLKFGRQIVDGAYAPLVEKVRSNSNPNFVLLQFDRSKRSVRSLHVVPRHFFTPDMILPRAPLGDHARRRGWVGCNILLEYLPQSARIHVVVDGAVTQKAQVLRLWAATSFLRNQALDATKNWLTATMWAIDWFDYQPFCLSDVYQREPELARVYPNNRNIRPKLRQQLQVLRNQGYVDFLGKGRYRRINPTGRDK